MDIEKEIQSLKERNMRVEEAKGWETSFTRRFFIALTTYVVALLWLTVIGETEIWLKAVVPVGGYILSTLSLSLIRKWWVAKYWKK